MALPDEGAFSTSVGLPKYVENSRFEAVLSNFAMNAERISLVVRPGPRSEFCCGMSADPVCPVTQRFPEASRAIALIASLPEPPKQVENVNAGVLVSILAIKPSPFDWQLR